MKESIGKHLMNNKIKWLSQLENSAHVGILVVDKERNNLFVNNRLCEMFGYAKETLLSSKADIFHVNNDTFLEFGELVFNSVLNGSSIGMDYEVKRSDGTTFWTHISGDPVENNEEVLWTLVDNTEIYDMNQSIKDLSRRSELALLGNNDGIWDLNLINNSVYFSPKWKEMIGYKDHELPNVLETWEKLVHPDDIEEVWTQVQEHTAGKTEYFEATERLRHKDGSWMWILARGKAVYNKEGKAIRMTGTHHDITEEVNYREKEKEYLQNEIEAKGKLLKLEEKFNRYFQLSLNLQLISTTDGIMQEVNSACKSILGYEKDELIGNQFLDLTHPDDVEPTIKEMSKLSRGENVYNFENRYIHKDGHYVNLLWSSTTDSSNNLIYATAQDITEQVKDRKRLKLQSELLEDRKKELETIIQENPHPMILHSEGGKIIMLNHAWVNTSGFTLEDTPTISDWINCAYEDKEIQTNLKKHINLLYEITETTHEGEFTFKNKNKESLTWQISSSPLGVIDGKRTIITSAMDITDMKNNEQLLFQQSKMAAMGEMISNIAHQWRQPLSVISTSATGAKAQMELGLLNEINIKSYFDTINNSAQYLSQTIDDFRGFFNPMNSKVREFNISDAITKSLNLVAAQFNAKGIEIIQNIEDFKLESIENELLQVLINILNNAKDALEKLENKKRFIFIDTYKKDNKLIIEIKDNANGINEDIIDRIFEPYFTTKHQSQGTGIGLYMSEEIIKNHLKGSLTVSNSNYAYEDVEYTGAKFTIAIIID